VIVSPAKSGSLKSGVSRLMPRSAALARKYAAFDDRADDAKP
jgi:hypothetical protein